MKTKFSGILTLLLAFVVQFTFAQEKTISGTVSDNAGITLPGVNIIIKGTTTGTQTDFDGNYNINASVGDVLTFSYLGFVTVEQTVGAANTINVSLEEDAELLDEVVVTGVAGATSIKKLSVTVAKVSLDEIEKVPAGSAASALQGKVAGITVTNLGRPGQGSTLLLRGAANFYGSNAPLVLLDGVYVEGGLGDINVDDIESFEIVKGASASSLYGSRAGNGVISITTKRGKLGKTQITVRSEVGFARINDYIVTNQSQGYELAADWEDFQGQYTKYAGVTYSPDYQGVWAASGPNAVIGSRLESPDGYSDNPYGVYTNLQDAFFKNGLRTTNYISMSSGTDKSRLFFSSENTTNDGVLEETDGYNRNSLRFNGDFYFYDWLKFTTSNAFIKLNDNDPGGGDDVYRTFARLSPDSQVFVDNPDGQPYYYKPDPWESEINNPLYLLWNRDAKAKQQRFLGSYQLNVKFSDAISAELEYAFESNTYRFTSNNKFETYVNTGDPVGFGYSEGSLSKNSSFELSQKAQATINIKKNFFDDTLEFKGQLSYLIEDRAYERFAAFGNNYLFRGLPTLDNFNIADVSASSNSENERAQNMFAIGGLVYKDRYIVDALFRRDGSSLFGANQRWNNYYRVSAAYRITQDIDIPGVQELKINVAKGTSGQRPGFTWQYEQTAISGGNLSTNRVKGNPDLKPSLTTENEIGINIDFLDRFKLQAAYSNQISSDQFMLVNLFAPANAGKNRQWQNVGNLETNTYEASLSSNIISSSDVNWSVTLNYATTESQITKLNAPEQKIGPNGLFLLREGIEYGSMFGRKFVTDLGAMANQLPVGTTISEYVVNRDGVVVRADAIGTTGEAGIIQVDENGTPVFEKIGSQNADFNLGIVSNFNYKKLDFYMLWDWKQGGDVYNANGQWTTISERNAIVDQAGYPDSEKKTRVYYGTLYDVNQNNAFWVEDGTYLKLKEASISYTFDSNQIPFFDQVKVSVIGRNILTFTDYLGWDPEIANYDPTTQQYFSVDYGVYPNNSSYSMSVQLRF